MEQAIYQALTDTLSSDNNVRKNATEKLQELEKTNLELSAILGRILASNECDSNIRQVAGVYLKNYINRHWSHASEKFQEPLPTPEVKAIVRELAFTTLSSNEYKARSTAALVVARLAHFDWPEDWGNFIDLLLQLISKGDRLGVHGGMKAFSEFVAKDLSDQQINNVGPILFPELLKIVTSENVFSQQTKEYAIEVFHGFITMMNTVKDTSSNLENTLLASSLPNWFQYFSHILENVEIKYSNIGILTQTITALQTIIEYFPRQLVGKENHFTTLIIVVLEKLADFYVASEVYGLDLPDAWSSNPESNEEQDEDIKFESLIYPAFDFLICLVTKKNKSAKDALIQAPLSLNRVFWILLKYHQITSEQVEQWDDDPNRFIVDEDDEFLNYSVRLTALDLFIHLINCYGDESIKALSAACEVHIQDATKQKQLGDSNWWVIVESCVSAVGNASYEIIDSFQDNQGPKIFDIGNFFSTVVMPLMTQSEFPLIQGRSFIFASQYGAILPEELAVQCLGHSLNMMTNATSILVNISCLKAINIFCTTLNRSVLTPVVPAIIQSTCTIASQCKDEILNLLFETWSSAFKVSQEVTAKYNDIFIPKLIETWSTAYNDQFTSILIRDIVKDLASNQLVYEPLVSNITPVILKLIASHPQDTQVLSSAIEICASLVEGGPSPLPAGFVANIFPSILSCCGKGDPELEASVQEFLKFAILKDLNQIIAWEHNGHNGLFYIVKYICDLLQPGKTQESLLSVGVLILTLLLKNTEAVLPYLNDILTPLTARIITTDSQILRQNFIMIIAQLCRTHLDVIIEFLKKPIYQFEDPLGAVLNIWCENHDSFSGYFQIKLSAFALSLIFVKNDPRVVDIPCKGKMIDINPGKIVTRSQTKAAGEHYVVLPAQARILSLLIADYRNDAYNAVLNSFGQFDEEEGDWQDADEGNGDPYGYEKGFDYMLEEDHFKLDQLYDFNLKEYLKGLFQAGLTNDTGSLQKYVRHLEKIDQETLRGLQ